MAATCIPHILLMVHRYIYSRYSPVFPMLYQLYYSLPSSTLYSSSSLYLKLQPELLLKVITDWSYTSVFKYYFSNTWTGLGHSGASLCSFRVVRLANSKAGIKPTAPLSVFDKKNSIEFPLDFLYYLYNYYMVCALLSHTYHVTPMWCDAVTSCHVTVMWHFPTLPSM